MYKVLIIDDEKFIRKSIRNRIEWEEYGFEVCAEAENGERGLEVMKEVRPNLVVVDIRMPVMDGLAFITEAKKQFPENIYVIMSAYSDFEYARKAIQIGIEDYVLKPVEEEEMYQILEKAKKKLDKMQFMKQMNGSGGEERQKTTGGIQVQEVVFWDKDEEYGGKIEECINAHSYVQKKEAKVYFMDGYSREHCFLFLLEGENFQRDDVRAMLEEITEVCGKEVRAAYSEIYAGTEVKKAAAECIQILQRKIFYPEKKVFCIGHFQREDEREKQYRKTKEALLQAEKSFLKQEYEKSLQEFSGIIEQTVVKENAAANIEEIIREIISFLSHYKEKQISQTDRNILFHRFESRDFLLSYDTAEELKTDLKSLFYSFMELSGCSREKETIDSVKDYIQENYAGNLNAAEIAAKFYLNPSYFSTLFKEKTGMKLTNYIEGIRMEKAKEYLKNDVWSITEIALETGYSESNYFSKVFKKYTGMSPKQYREKMCSSLQ